MRLCPTCGARYQPPAQFCQRDGAQLRIEQESQDPYLGTKILGQFRLESVLGSGGMGVVYSAWDEGLGRRVAVKILHRDLVTNRDVVQRFHREAQIAHQLDHPNIVRLILFGQLPDGNLYLVLEYLEGPTLGVALDESGPFAPDRAVKVCASIADAIGYAHRRDIVHRDLKPENIILVNREGEADFAKVLDFGIAKMLIGGDTLVTQAGLIFGTARYISPEGAQGDAVDRRSDVYSLGVITYQLLTGRTPFDAAEPVQLLLKHIHEQPPPIHSHPAGRNVPTALQAVVMRSLAKIPAARYGDGAAFARALREALAQSDPESAIRSVVPTAAMPMYVPANATAGGVAVAVPPEPSSSPAHGVAAPNPSAFAEGQSGVRPYPAEHPTGSSSPVSPVMPAGTVAGWQAPYGSAGAGNGNGHGGRAESSGANGAVSSARASFLVNPPPSGPLPQQPARGSFLVEQHPSQPARGSFLANPPQPAHAGAGSVLVPRPSRGSLLVPADAGGGVGGSVVQPGPAPAQAYGYAPPVEADSAPAVHPTGGYHPVSRVHDVQRVLPTESEEEIEIPGLKRRRKAEPGARGSSRTALVVVGSVVLTLALGIGAVSALGLLPSQRQEAQINELLLRAQDALQQGHFAHDAVGTDVEDLTDAVLVLAPGNARAKELRAAAAAHLRNDAVELRNGGHPDQAIPLLWSAVRLADDDRELHQLIDQFRTESPQAAQPAQPTQPPANGAPRNQPVRVAPGRRPGAPAAPGQPAIPGQPAQPAQPTAPVQLTPTFTPGRDPAQPPPAQPPPPAAPPVVIQHAAQPPPPAPVVQPPPPAQPPPAQPPPAQPDPSSQAF